MFRELAPGLHLQPSLLYQTNCVITADAAGVTCIDPNYFDGEILGARALFDELCAARQGARRIAFTHSDFDHIVGAPYFEDAESVMHAAWDEANEARARDAIRRFDGEHYIARGRRPKRPLRRDLAIREDGERLGEFICFLAQGHTDDGLVLFHRPTRALIVGDYLSDCEFPFIYTSARRYMATVQKFERIVADLRPDLLISQHGPPAEGAQAIAARLAESRTYLEALLAAASSSASPEEAAARCAAAWRGVMPDYLSERHLENARLGVRERDQD